MSAKAEALSRILGVRIAADAAPASPAVGVQPLTTAKVIEVSRIIPDPEQPRKTFVQDDLDDLAASMRDLGQTDPVKVRWDAGRDRYVLIDGERRYRAAQLAGLPSLSAIVDNRPMSADRVLEFQLVENALRTDLQPIEAGAAYKQLMAVWNVNQQQLAARLHISPSKVSRAIASLDLPDDVQQAVVAGKAGAISAVVKHRRKATRKTSRPKAVRVPTSVGVVVVTPKPGVSIIDVLLAAVDAERKRGAA